MRCRGTDLRSIDGQYYIRYVGKGGRVRLALLCGSKAEIQTVVKMMKAAGNEKVFPSVPSHADIHAYRSDYAMRIYHLYARPLNELKDAKWYNPARRRMEGAAYIFRKGSFKGIVIDKAAAFKAAEYLGHSRIDVFCNNYFRA